jgi:glutamine amidotransferase
VIAVVDVCSGNLRSVERALAKVGGDVVVTRDPDVVRRADKIVVPGQGAFGVFMRGLDERGLGEALREAIASGKPYLGICLGLQVLFDESEEQGPEWREQDSLRRPGTIAGLGIVRGRVVKLAPGDARLKVPHMGWNSITKRIDDPLLAGVADGAYVYFVHSYHAVPDDPSLLAATSEHGHQITAAIRRDNLFACQFHPEKSQGVGLAILERFVR